MVPFVRSQLLNVGRSRRLVRREPQERPRPFLTCKSLPSNLLHSCHTSLQFGRLHTGALGHRRYPFIMMVASLRSSHTLCRRLTAEHKHQDTNNSYVPRTFLDRLCCVSCLRTLNLGWTHSDVTSSSPRRFKPLIAPTTIRTRSNSLL